MATRDDMVQGIGAALFAEWCQAGSLDEDAIQGYARQARAAARAFADTFERETAIVVRGAPPLMMGQFALTIFQPRAGAKLPPLPAGFNWPALADEAFRAAKLWARTCLETVVTA